MKFSLVHPSRGRVACAEAAVQEWASKRSRLHDGEHILSVDADDDVQGCETLAARHELRLTVKRQSHDGGGGQSRRGAGDRRRARDLTEMARQDGVPIDARHLRFPHRHYSVGLSRPDPAYQRQNSRRAWRHGWRVDQKRRFDGFGQRERDWTGGAAQFRVDLYYGLRIDGIALRLYTLRAWSLTRFRGLKKVRAVALRVRRRISAVDAPDA